MCLRLQLPAVFNRYIFMCASYVADRSMHLYSGMHRQQRHKLPGTACPWNENFQRRPGEGTQTTTAALPMLCFSFLFSHTSTFQLLDKPWSQVPSLLPPGSCLQFLSRIGFSNPAARRFFIECAYVTNVTRWSTFPAASVLARAATASMNNNSVQSGGKYQHNEHGACNTT